MLSRKTVFVVGAGASAEVGLPVGWELAREIARSLALRRDSLGDPLEDRDLLRFLMRLYGSIPVLNDHLAVARQISEGVLHHRSIDNYVDAHSHDDRIAALAKAVIAYVILKKERHSPLFVDRSKRSGTLLSIEKVEKAWYPEFAALLLASVKARDLSGLFENVSVISFNYDRCVEHYLSEHLAAAFGISLPEARAEVARLEVLRPYGGLGNMPSQVHPNGIEFGADPHQCDARSVVSNIKTYSEQVGSGVVNAIKARIAEADKLVFLGFGYHRQNLDLLAVNSTVRTIFASGWGLSEPNAAAIRDELERMLQSEQRPGSSVMIHLEPTKQCAALLRDYSRAIASR